MTLKRSLWVAILYAVILLVFRFRGDALYSDFGLQPNSNYIECLLLAGLCCLFGLLDILAIAGASIFSVMAGIEISQNRKADLFALDKSPDNSPLSRALERMKSCVAWIATTSVLAVICGNLLKHVGGAA